MTSIQPTLRNRHIKIKLTCCHQNFSLIHGEKAGECIHQIEELTDPVPDWDDAREFVVPGARGLATWYTTSTMQKMTTVF